MNRQQSFCTLPIFLLLLSISCSFSLPSFAQSLDCKIFVTGLPGKKGQLLIGWFNKPEGFRDPSMAVYKKKVPINGEKEMAILFNGILPGTYAITLFLDENDNNKLDKNFLGVPSEYYGFSNNVYPLTRAASFEETKFVLNKPGQLISIQMK